MLQPFFAESACQETDTSESFKGLENRFVFDVYVLYQWFDI